MKSTVKVKLIIALVLVVSSLGCCGRYLVYWDRHYSGRVIDKETGEPIEGAVVAADYHIRTLSPAGDVGSEICCKETFTDEQGKFRIPFMAYLKPYAIFSYLASGPAIGVFQPGYEGVYAPNIEQDAEYCGFHEGAGKELVIKIRRLRTEKELLLGEPLNGSPCREYPNYLQHYCPILNERLSDYLGSLDKN